MQGEKTPPTKRKQRQRLMDAPARRRFTDSIHASLTSQPPAAGWKPGMTPVRPGPPSQLPGPHLPVRRPPGPRPRRRKPRFPPLPPGWALAVGVREVGRRTRSSKGAGERRGLRRAVRARGQARCQMGALSVVRGPPRPVVRPRSMSCGQLHIDWVGFHGVRDPAGAGSALPLPSASARPLSQKNSVPHAAGPRLTVHGNPGPPVAFATPKGWP